MYCALLTGEDEDESHEKSITEATEGRVSERKREQRVRSKLVVNVAKGHVKTNLMLPGEGHLSWQAVCQTEYCDPREQLHTTTMS